MRPGIFLTLLSYLMPLAASSPVYAQQAKSFRTTYPQPPKAPPSNPLAVYPGYQVPEFPEKYTWRVAPPKGGARASSPETTPTTTTTTAPVYAVGPGGRLVGAGSINFGVEVKLEEFRVLGQNIFYRLPAELVTNLSPGFAKEGGGPFLLSGFFIEAASLNAAAK